jgi:hypothetical protein
MIFNYFIQGSAEYLLAPIVCELSLHTWTYDKQE